MRTPDWVWKTLGIEATRDRKLIRRAYAERLRENPPGTDAQSFERLRRAYELALAGAAISSGPAPAPTSVSAPPSAAPAEAPPNAAPTDTGPSSPPAMAPHPPTPPPATAPDDTGTPVATAPDPAQTDPGSSPSPAMTLHQPPPPPATAPDDTGTPVATAPDAAATDPAPSSPPIVAPDRPPPPPATAADDRATLVAAAREAYADFTALLSGRLSCDDARLEASMHRAINTAGALPIVEWPHFERALARQLATHSPRSDPLLEGAARRLGWGRDHYGAALVPAVDQIMERIEALKIARNLREGDGTAARALAVLGAPLPAGGRLRRWRYGFGNAEGVQFLLEDFAPEHPALRSLMSAQTAQWWLGYLAKPRVSQRLVVGAALVSAYALVPLAIWWRIHPASIATSLWLYAAASGPAIATGWLGLVSWPRFVLRREDRLFTSLPVRVGWLPVSLGLVVVALWLPDEPASILGIGVAGILATSWASARGMRNVPHRIWPRVRVALGLLGKHLPMAGWALLIAITAPAPLGVATVAALCAAVAGEPDLNELVEPLGGQVRLYFAGGIAATCALVGVQIWRALADDAGIGTFAVSVATMVLASRFMPVRWSSAGSRTWRGGYWVALLLAQVMRLTHQPDSGSALAPHALAVPLAVVLVIATIAGIWTNLHRADD